MSSLVKLLPGGTHIRATCDCGHYRDELVNPALNPNPFMFQPNCTACGQPLDPDMDRVIGMQISYATALSMAKKTAQSKSDGRIKEEKAPVHRNIQQRSSVLKRKS